MKTGIIIPCYNEEKRLNVMAFADFIKFNFDYHLCFVNDGSKDETLKILKKLKENAPSRISVIDIKRNKGKAVAIRAGARYLFNRRDIDYIGFIEAGLSSSFSDFQKLVASLDKNKDIDVVYGLGAKRKFYEEKGFFRNLLSKVINKLVHLILKLPLEDAEYKVRVFRRHIIPVIFIKRFLSRYLFDIEILVRLKKHFGKGNVTGKIYEQKILGKVDLNNTRSKFHKELKMIFTLCNIWFSYSILQTWNMFSLSTLNPDVEIDTEYCSLNDRPPVAA